MEQYSDDRMAFLDTIRDKETEIRILKDDIQQMSLKISAPFNEKENSLGKISRQSRSWYPMESTKEVSSGGALGHHRKSTPKTVSFEGHTNPQIEPEKRKDSELVEATHIKDNPKHSNALLETTGPLGRDGNSQGVPQYVPIDEGMLSPQLVMRTGPSE